MSEDVVLKLMYSAFKKELQKKSRQQKDRYIEAFKTLPRSNIKNLIGSIEDQINKNSPPKIQKRKISTTEYVKKHASDII